MFLHITTRIPGRKNDNMLTKIGGRGFPTFAAMSSTGEVMAKPRRRTLESFESAMAEAAELEGELRPAKAGDEKALRAGAAMEMLRRVKMGTLSQPSEDRAAYLRARGALTAAQRKLVEEALIISELTIAQRNYTIAKTGSVARERAVLAMLAAKEKLGGTWPMIGISNRVLINLLDWAEHRKDPQLYQVLFDEFVKVRRKLFGNRNTNEAFIQKHRDRLDRLWKGLPRVGERRTIRRR